ncbi:hypothetical protein [Micromonospora palythoicola]
MTVRPDVVVLGAGVAGLSTGIRLAEAAVAALRRGMSLPAVTTARSVAG